MAQAQAPHTRGPWEIHEGVLPQQPYSVDVTAKTSGWQPNGETPEGWFIATVHSMEGSEANARLIAAAPDMLATLGEVVSGMDEAVRILDLMGRGGDARNLQRLAGNARAVIRKAEGL